MLLTKALSLPDYSCWCDELRDGDAAVRHEIERVRRRPQLPAHARERLDGILKGTLPRELPATEVLQP